MKIVHIQTGLSDSGNSVFRLHELMLKHGLDSNVLCATSTVKGNKIVTFSKLKIKYYALLNIITRITLRDKIKSNFSYPLFGHNLAKYQLVKSADIIYLHWTQGGFLNINGLRKILTLGKPVLFSCRDFWYLTGGCHHPVSCEKYLDHCGSCMYLQSDHYKDLSNTLFDKKLKLYSEHTNLYFFVSSSWMLSAARSSALTKNKLSFCIANVLDKAVFKKQDKLDTRADLKLPKDKILILFGAVSPTSNKNKGWDYLVESLEILKLRSQKDFDLVIFGTGNDDEIQKILPYQVHFLGVINDEIKLAKVYAACDVYATPSLSEPFGNTVLESLSCQTPVVAFNIGGAIDMIMHQRNGYLAAFRDSKDFAAGIQYCIDNKISGFLKQEIEPEYSIRKHIDLIEQLTKK